MDPAIKALLSWLAEKQWSKAELGRKIGTSSQAIGNWIARGSLPKEWQMPVATVFGRSIDELLSGGQDRPEPKRVDSDEAGVVSVARVSMRLQAGVPGFMVEYIDRENQPIFFRESWLTQERLSAKALVALRVSGASMEPGLYDGDTVVINTQDSTPRDGEVFAINYEGQLLIKRLKREVGVWWLISDNPDKRRFSDKRLETDAESFSGVFLLGRVIHKSSKHI